MQNIMDNNSNNIGLGNFGESATFNQAVFQQVRMNKLMDRINECSTNPLAYNLDMCEFNYKIIFSDLCSLLSEISSKLTPEEKNLILHEKNLIDAYINEIQLFENKKNVPLKKNVKLINPITWNPLKNSLYMFKINIIELMEKHGFGNPSKDDPRFASLKR